MLQWKLNFAKFVYIVKAATHNTTEAERSHQPLHSRYPPSELRPRRVAESSREQPRPPQRGHPHVPSLQLPRAQARGAREPAYAHRSGYSPFVAMTLGIPPNSYMGASQDRHMDQVGRHSPSTGSRNREDRPQSFPLTRRRSIPSYNLRRR